MDTFETLNIKRMHKELEEYDPLFDRFFNDYASFENRRYDFYDALKEISAIEKTDRRNFKDYDYNKLKSLIEFIYGSNESFTMAEIISLVYEKFIRDFLNIPHLDKLFNEKYFEYEWEMHSNLDEEHVGVNFYRDHYFHQARNLYEAYKFFKIGDNALLKKIIDLIKQSDSSTARYCADAINAAKTYYLGNLKYYEIFKKLTRDSSEKEAIEDYFENYAYSYIIRGAIYVSALTHDIGYPVDKHLQKSKQFTQFLSQTAFNKKIFDFDNIRNIVESSILFAIVGAEKIKEALDKRTKYDHGVVSALVLLIHYYEHGTLNKLDPLKRAAIELAALINFDHTASYALGNEKEISRENYPCYQKNPLSIIFRLFDDIQEWDRVYFDVSEYSSIRICAKCKKPMIKQPIVKDISNKEYFREKDDNDRANSFIINEFTKFRHQCGCQDNNWCTDYEIDYGSYKQQMSFNNKKISYVKVCKSIYYSLIKNRKKTILQVFIDYNPYKLLEMLRLSKCSFHSHRLEEIDKLKKIIEGARIEGWDVELISDIQIDPIYLKQKIIYDYLFAVFALLVNKEKFKFQLTEKFKNVYPLFKYECVFSEKLDVNLLEKFLFNKKYENVTSSVYYICKNLKLVSIPANKSRSKDEMDVAEIIRSVTNAIFPDNGSDKQIDCMFKYFEPRENCYKIGDPQYDLKMETDAIEKEYSSFIARIVNSDNYTGESKKSPEDFKNDTNDFYNDLYILGLMNDYTEMFKTFLSEEFNDGISRTK